MGRITALVGPTIGHTSQRDAAIQLRAVRSEVAELAAEKAKLSSRVVTLQDKLAAAERQNATQQARLESALAENERLQLLSGEKRDRFTNACGENIAPLARELSKQLASK